MAAAPTVTSLEVEGDFHYAEIYNPLSSMERRFIYVDK
jgi:hypothetical protein